MMLSMEEKVKCLDEEQEKATNKMKDLKVKKELFSS